MKYPTREEKEKEAEEIIRRAEKELLEPLRKGREAIKKPRNS